MTEVRVDPIALEQLAEAFRIVATIGIPPIGEVRTGHAQLDEAISDLCNAVHDLSSSSQRAAESQADSVGSAADGYRTTEQTLSWTLEQR